MVGLFQSGIQLLVQVKEFLVLRVPCGIRLHGLAGLEQLAAGGGDIGIQLRADARQDGRAQGRAFGVLQSADGKVNVNCGSGFTEADRRLDWSKNIGKVVTIETEGLIQDKRTKAYSLYLPVFVELRADKTEANTLEEIQDMDIRPEGREKHITPAQYE